MRDVLRMVGTCLSLLIPFSRPPSTHGETRGGGTAVVLQRVHPVLIRNDHNALFHLVVAAQSPLIMVSSITVSLAGTDDRDDIDSLKLFFTDEESELLDEGRGRAYPSLSRIDNSHVGLVYEGSRADPVFERFSLNELLKR